MFELVTVAMSQRDAAGGPPVSHGLGPRAMVSDQVPSGRGPRGFVRGVHTSVCLILTYLHFTPTHSCLHIRAVPLHTPYYTTTPHPYIPRLRPFLLDPYMPMLVPVHTKVTLPKPIVAPTHIDCRSRRGPSARFSRHKPDSRRKGINWMNYVWILFT